MKISNIQYQISNTYQRAKGTKGVRRAKRVFSFGSFVPFDSFGTFQGGFTLIEIIVVIGIISILSAMIITLIDPFSQFQKARDAQRKSDLSQVQKELEQYYQDTGHYPGNTVSYQIIGLNSGTIAWGSSNVNNWPYANQLPKDPDTSRTYVYYSSGGQSYWLYASLERGRKDPQACNNGNTCASITTNSIPTTACGTSVLCNYGVSSPNTTP